jgi:peptidoglycan/xylan/chitin deacetylase (PgdA/CDA1 family)
MARRRERRIRAPGRCGHWALLLAAALGCSAGVVSPRSRPAEPVRPAPLAAPRPAEPVAPASTRAPPRENPAFSAKSAAPQAEPPAEAPRRERFRQPVVPRAETRALVLLYHDFSDVASSYSTPPDRLERHVEWLTENVDIVSLAELQAFLEGELELPERVAVITIDDGLETAYTRAFPIMKRHGARFSVGVPTALLERWHEQRAVGWPELREMFDSGLCEIASHSDSHKDLTRIRDDLLDRELVRSREIIKERLGVDPQAFFYPYGNHDPFVQRQTRAAGYRLGFGVSTRGSRLVRADTERWAIPRQAIEGSMSASRLALYFGPPASRP